MKPRAAKRRKLIAKKVADNKEIVNDGKDRLTTQVPNGCYTIILNHLSASDVNAVAKVNKQLGSLANAESTWRHLYRAHVGKIYCQQEYKAQYYAETLRRNPKSIFSGGRQYQKLTQHVKAYANSPWTTFYTAYAQEHELFGDRSTVKDLCFTAIQAGDARAIQLLCSHFRDTLRFDLLVSRADVEKFAKLVTQNPGDNLATPQELCLIHCLRYRCAEDDKENLKHTALEYFFEISKIADVPVETFFSFVSDVFYLLNMVTDTQRRELLNNHKLKALPNVGAVLIHENIHEILLRDRVASATLNAFYKNLLQEESTTLSKIALTFCQKKDWQRCLWKILLLQKSAAAANAPKEIFAAMLQGITNPDKASVFLRCAVTFVYLAHNRQAEAREQFMLACLTDSFIFAKFSGQSLTFGVAQNSQLLQETCLLNQPQQRVRKSLRR